MVPNTIPLRVQLLTMFLLLNFLANSQGRADGLGMDTQVEQNIIQLDDQYQQSSGGYDESSDISYIHFNENEYVLAYDETRKVLLHASLQVLNSSTCSKRDTDGSAPDDITVYYVRVDIFCTNRLSEKIWLKNYYASLSESFDTDVFNAGDCPSEVDIFAQSNAACGNCAIYIDPAERRLLYTLYFWTQCNYFPKLSTGGSFLEYNTIDNPEAIDKSTPIEENEPHLPSASLNNQSNYYHDPNATSGTFEGGTWRIRPDGMYEFNYGGDYVVILSAKDAPSEFSKLNGNGSYESNSESTYSQNDAFEQAINKLAMDLNSLDPQDEAAYEKLNSDYIALSSMLSTEYATSQSGILTQPSLGLTDNNQSSIMSSNAANHSSILGNEESILSTMSQSNFWDESSLPNQTLMKDQNLKTHLNSPIISNQPTTQDYQNLGEMNKTINQLNQTITNADENALLIVANEFQKQANIANTSTEMNTLQLAAGVASIGALIESGIDKKREQQRIIDETRRQEQAYRNMQISTCMTRNFIIDSLKSKFKYPSSFKSNVMKLYTYFIAYDSMAYENFHIKVSNPVTMSRLPDGSWPLLDIFKKQYADQLNFEHVEMIGFYTSLDELNQVQLQELNKLSQQGTFFDEVKIKEKTWNAQNGNVRAATTSNSFWNE
jgi:hypothetical protein